MSDPDHPYRQQPPRAFWDSAVSDRHPLDIGDWYRKRFDITGAPLATAGSCFAQHLGRGLLARGLDFLDVEPAPAALPADQHAAFGHGLYSARYGNIYTARQFVQLLDRALGRFDPVEDHWEKDGGIVDPFRPTIEPEPFGSVAEMRALRADHLARVVDLFTRAEVIVFTLGLTEAWLSRQDGAVFPACPGTSAGGRFDPARHGLHTLTVAETRDDMARALAMARSLNPRARMILTVSPVSMMATAGSEHVAVASMHSKAILRAAAGELVGMDAGIDYFPSYEILTAPFMGGFFHQPDKRQIAPAGVDHVMRVFFGQHGTRQTSAAAPETVPMRPRPAPALCDDEGVVCDEELLAAFAPETALRP